MYLFGRRGVLTGAPRETIPWALDITEYVKKVSGRDVTLWSGMFGYPLGTVVWSVALESLADLDSAFGGLAEDDGYHERVAAGGAHLSGTEDTFREVVHVPAVELELGPTAVVSTTTAVMSVGSFADAVGWGVGMAQFVEEVGGIPCMFLLDAYGDFGRVTWLAATNDSAAADAANAKVNSNDRYVAQLDEARDLFIPGSGHHGLVRRIG